MKNLTRADYIKPLVPTIKKNSRWGSDLPEDIKRSIMEKLFLADQARFVSVCRRLTLKPDVNGPMALPLPSPLKQFPWLFTMQFKWEKNSSTWCFRLFDPMYKKNYLIPDTSFLDDIGDQARMSLIFWTSIDSWVLISARFRRKEENNILFFYNPFTGEKVRLPCLVSSLERVTCSSPPTSSECLVFVAGYDGRFTTFHRCHPTDKTWSAIDIKRNLSCIHSLVYVSNILYSYSYRKKIVSVIDFGLHTVGEYVWREVALPEFSERTSFSTMIESAGDILLLIFRCRGNAIRHIFKLECESGTMSWVKLESIGNRAVFVSDSISFDVSNQSTSTTRVTESNGIYPDHILHFFLLNEDRNSYVSKIYASAGLPRRDLVGYVKPFTFPCL